MFNNSVIESPFREASMRDSGTEGQLPMEVQA